MFTCSRCDAQYPKWSGRCVECGAWGTVGSEESNGSAPKRASSASPAKATTSTALKDAKAAGNITRIPSGDAEVDRVLGGGFVPGSLTLLSGEPGIGKSTLVAQIAAAIAAGQGLRPGVATPPHLPDGGGGPPLRKGRALLDSSRVDTTPLLSKEGLGGGLPPVASASVSILYVSGEESAAQLADRFERLGGLNASVRYLEAHPIETLVATIEKEKPAMAIIDSVQTLSSSELEGTPGSPTLVRYATSLLLELSKRSGVAILLIGQVTKDGGIAGPKMLEHLVDAVLTLEGDPMHAYRLLRSSKNRFGATHEVGVFEMTGTGLTAVENPSARFLAERVNVAGSVIAASMEGSRVFLVEVQALVDKMAFSTPVRRASGFDGNRLQMLCAILSRRTKANLSEKDVYVNVVGGMELHEPAADLAVCAAIMGALKNEATGPVLAIGEVGLGGEVRSVPQLDRRLAEAKRMGITNVITPKMIKLVSEL